jgi:phosphatidate cytidylyltransferase
MKTRAITGFFFVLVMLASTLTGPYAFTIFFGLLGLACLNEFYNLVKTSGIIPDKILGLFSGSVIFGVVALACLNTLNVTALVLIIPLISLVFVSELFKKSVSPFGNIAFTFLGFFFTIMPFCFFYAMAFIGGSFNFHYPLAFLVLLWANDTGAYLVGVKFGKTKLFERHSPKKTWEGFLGGMFIAILVSFVLSVYFNELSWRNWLSIAILIAGVGTLGDLVESMFKRSINAKDSGTLLPGHGGVLDRFDGLLLAAPIVFTYLYFVSNY